MHRIGVRAVSFTFCVMFILSLVTSLEGGLSFWTSFGLFIATAVYMCKHEKRLLRELDDWFDESDDTF